jgi:5-methyltetrahydrofolate--homocysteine methyltransferase
MTEHLTTTITSKSKTVQIGRHLPTAIIGERINPTGRKKLAAAIAAEDFDMVKQDAINQVAAGAAILDVNAGIPDANETVLLTKMVRSVSEVVDLPLCIDTANSDALAAALDTYKGKALINSVNGEAQALDRILPLAATHGAALIGLCMDDEGIPGTVDKRLAVADRIIDRAGRIGIPVEDIIIDPLVLSVGTNSNAGRIALQTIEKLTQEFGVNITMGTSNISFGLPDRDAINAAFVAMAIQAGATCPIANPLAPGLTSAVLAADLAMGKDEWAMRWIEAYREKVEEI